MPTILTPTAIVELGRASTYLSANYVSEGSMFGARVIKPNLPVQIAFVTDGLDWGNNNSETDASIRSTSNYAYWLYGRFQLEAQGIINGAGGGSVVPTPSGGSLPNPYDWQVDNTTSSTQPLKAGDSSVYLDGTNGTQDYRGYNILFFKGGEVQNTTNLGDGSSYYQWNRNTGLFQVFPSPVQFGDLLIILPSR